MIEQGDIIKCDECSRARPIQKPVVEVFGDRIGFGPAGETDMFVESGGTITCYWCLDDIKYGTEIVKSDTDE